MLQQKQFQLETLICIALIVVITLWFDQTLILFRKKIVLYRETQWCEAFFIRTTGKQNLIYVLPNVLNHLAKLCSPEWYSPFGQLNQSSKGRCE